MRRSTRVHRRFGADRRKIGGTLATPKTMRVRARDFAAADDKHGILRRKVAHAWLDFVATNQVRDGPEVRVGASGIR